MVRGEMFGWGARAVWAQDRVPRFGGEYVGAGGEVCGGGEARGRVGVGCEGWKVWRENSSSARDELHAGLWGEQVREREEDLGWRMQTCSRGSGIYRHVLVVAGVSSSGACGG